MTTKKIIASFIAVATTLVGVMVASESAAADEPPSQEEIIALLDAKAKVVPSTVQDNAPLIVVVDDQGRVVPTGLDTPQFSAGLGWYVYLYFTRSEWRYLQGLGYAALSAAVCAWLAATIAGAIACGVVAYVLYDIVDDYGLPPVGYCKEVKFSYGGSLKGVKNVKRSC